MEKLLHTAQEIGFSKAVYLPGLSVKCRPELRACCNPRQCRNHGKNWVCPPNCGPLGECRKKADRFREGILLQSIACLEPFTETEVYQALNREHNFRLKKLIEAVKPDFDDLLPLTSGGCVFCDTCAFPEPCIKPEVKMESLSAFGIDVGGLCAKAKLPYSFRDDIVYFTALLLIKKGRAV